MARTQTNSNSLANLKSRRGIKHTQETKDKISKAKKGKPAWNKGKPAPWTTKRNIENNHLHTGENAYNWKGGIMKKQEYDGEYRRNWYANLTEEKRKEYSWSKNKRNRLKNATIKELGTHTYGEWELLKKQYGYTCPRCELSEPFDQRSKWLTEDHIIPLSKGGSDLIENIQPLCLSCNIKKHTLIIKY